jgi:NAD(P)-dependent dehydrogenase (short-subunit alcohol dehydrogenase family)
MCRTASFGRIDVHVPDAGNFYRGFFEEPPAEDFRGQVATSLFGPVNVTRAALPVMRAQRSSMLVTISSIAGHDGQPFVCAYAAAKFDVKGWMESPTGEVARLGIRTMLVEPGLFRTEPLSERKAKSVEDYEALLPGHIAMDEP